MIENDASVSENRLYDGRNKLVHCSMLHRRSDALLSEKYQKSIRNR